MTTSHDLTRAPGPEIQPSPEADCRACRGRRWWRKHSGDWACARCHPPQRPGCVAEWTGVEETYADIAARLGKHIGLATGVWPVSEWGSGGRGRDDARRQKPKEAKPRPRKARQGLSTELDALWRGDAA
jgi:hypothetical protein